MKKWKKMMIATSNGRNINNLQSIKDMAKVIPVKELTVKQALKELEVLSESVDFDTEFDEDTPVKKLRELVKEGREAVENAEEDEDEDEKLGGEDDDEVDLEEEATPKGKGVNVYDKNGKHVRTYTEKEHGKGFRAIAKQFLEKSGREGYTLKEAK